MNITILCDQKDCIYNVGSKVHHDHDTDKCEHHYPVISFLNALNGLPATVICTSKTQKDTPFDDESAMMDTPPEIHKCFVEPLPGKPNLRFKKK